MSNFKIFIIFILFIANLFYIGSALPTLISAKSYFLFYTGVFSFPLVIMLDIKIAKYLKPKKGK